MQENAGQIIEENEKLLRTDVVILGINASNRCKNWSNYHWGGRSADKNLMFAFDKSPYRGCYMSDFSQKIHKKGAVVYSELLADKSKLRFTRASLTKELNDIGVPKNAVFLLLGTYAAKLFKITLLEEYSNYQ